MLRRGHLGKVAAQAVVLVVVLGAVWWYVAPRGIGRAEADDRVLVVNTSGTRYRPRLEAWGFDAHEGRLPELIEELREALPDAEETGAAAALKLADWSGFAYVAFEDPAAVDFTGVDLAGGPLSFAAHHRFAVVSAGDRGSPHVLTVNPPPSPARHGAELDLLTALFAQEALAATLRADVTGATEVVQLRERVQGGILAVEAIPAAEAAIEGIELRARATLNDREKAEPRPRLLGTVHEDVIPTPLADGGLLLRVRAVRFSDSFSGALDIDAVARWLYVPPGADPATERMPCDSLSGGTFDDSIGRAEVVAAPQGDALLIAAGGRGQLWRLAGEKCRFELLGDIPVPMAPADMGQPHRSGAVARADGLGSEGFVYLVKPNDEAPHELMRTRSILHLPTWLADDALAAAESPGKSGLRDSLILLSTAHPDRALRVDAAEFDGASGILQIVAAPPGPSGPRLLVTTTGDRGQRLFRVDLPAPVPELVAAAVARVNMKAQPAAVRDGSQSLVVTLAHPSGWAFAPLTPNLDVTSPAVAPDGRFVAFATDSNLSGRHELVSVPLVGGPMRTLTHNDLDDRDPRFSADGRTIVFTTTFPIERTRWTLTAARSLPPSE
ncbi:TolB family protein [Nannocystis radixulma]|uniref:WD40-like Beta Propeller Repeat n=1 Tax=Nannocystis radixulma TaxID=2995305 RepID=A0ABT5BNG2_9BACT|nr:hypothetical protein [Nannocystis radixulma]MDC0675688.1 hypothetical protein [Nannocystis radixulma]